MTDAVQVALIVSVPSTIAALGTLIVSLRTHGQVVEVKKEMNGMQTKLLVSTGKEAYARGMKDEKEGNGGNTC